MTAYRLTITESEHADTRKLQLLAKWLRADEHVGDQAEVHLPSAPPAVGEMGSAFDAVQVVVDNGFQLANLILAVATWRRTSPGKPGVVIERNGTRVTIDSDDPEKIAQIAEALSDAS